MEDHANDKGKARSASSKGAGFKRRIRIVNPRFQGTILGVFGGLSAMMCGVIYLSIWSFFRGFDLTKIDTDPAIREALVKLVMEQRADMDRIFILTSIMIVSLMMLGAILLTHRVAGPLYRLEQHLKGIAEGGKVGDVKFRKGDFFQEVAEVFNRAIRRIREDSGQERSEKNRENGKSGSKAV